MWVGEAYSLQRDGCVLALQEAGAGGHHQLRLPQQPADLGGEPQVSVMGIPRTEMMSVNFLNSEQTVTCIWHRQSDTMMWWPQNLKECNSESSPAIYIKCHHHENVSFLFHFHDDDALLDTSSIR